ncbi:MAG: FecR domain-containing protein, partial [Pseudomonadota bacterium]
MSIPSSHVDPTNGFPNPAQSLAGRAPEVTLPSAQLITDGQFERAGADLKVSGPDGQAVVVTDYFAASTPPDLISPDGTQILTPALVQSFMAPLAPAQYAQAAPVAGAAAPIGQVIDIQGDAVAVRADGSRVTLGQGDPVYEGDVIETAGDASAIRMVFSDQTEFSLGADARLALDQLVFNPDTQSGSAQFSILKGVFIFASGQIAKTDNTDMTVSTPVATIGIRGTEVAGRVAEGDSQFTIIDGAIQVTTRAGSVTLDDDGETTQVAGNDTLPSDPVILTPAQFEQAYGQVSGVVSTYFQPTQPGTPGNAPGGGTAPGEPAGEESTEPLPSGSGDRAETGTVAGTTMLASTLPADPATGAGILPPVSPPSPFVSDPSAYTPLFEPFSPVASAAGSSPSAGGASGLGLPGASPDSGSGGQETGGGSETSEEIVVAAIPGIDFADGITFSGVGGSGGGPGGFNLGPSGGPANGPGDPVGPVQVSFPGSVGVPGTPGAPVVPAPGADEPAPVNSPPLDVPSNGASESPFRSGSGGSDFGGDNPYVSQPFGYAGPQLGDAVFDLVAGDPVSAESGSDLPADDPNTAGVVTGGDGTTDNDPPPPPPEAGDGTVADIQLTVSNATRSTRFQDLTYSFDLPNGGPDSTTVVGGDEMDLPRVGDDAEIEVARDAEGDVKLELTSPWNSVKNIRAESDTAADIHIDNFVHADVHFGDGGDSHITLVDAKRGFITTGDGDDRVEVSGQSFSTAWSNLFDVRTGDGN